MSPPTDSIVEILVNILKIAFNFMLNLHKKEPSINKL